MKITIERIKKNKITQLLQRLLFLLLFLSLALNLAAQDSINPKCLEGEEIIYKLDYFNQPDLSIKTIEKLLPGLFESQCWDIYADGLNVITAAYFYKREYGKARETSIKAVDIALKYNGKDLKYAAAIANLSHFSGYRESIDLQLESLELERKWTPNSENEAIATENLGLSYQKIGDYDTGINYLEQAGNIFKLMNGENSHEEGRVYRQIASCFKAKNLNDKALSKLMQSIAILEKLPAKKHFRQTLWYAYVEVAELYNSLDKYESGRHFIEKAIKIQEEYKLLEAYKGWLTIGEIYKGKRDDKQALYYFNKAIIESKEEFEQYKYNVGLAKPYYEVAKLYHGKGVYKEALENYSTALKYLAIDFKPEDVFENPSRHEFVNRFEVVEILKHKAKTLSLLYDKTGEIKSLESAHQTYLLATQLIHGIRLDYVAEGSKHTLIKKVSSVYENAIGIAIKLAEKTNEEAYIKDAFMFAESNKSVLLYESVKNKKAKSIAAIPDSILKEESYLRAELSLYETQLLEEKLKGTDSELSQQLEKKIFDFSGKYQKYLKLMESNYPEYKKQKNQTEPKSLLEVQKEISDTRTAIVEFVIGEEMSYVFFITKENIFVLPISDKSVLAKEVTTIRNIIISPPGSSAIFKTDYDTFCQSAFHLYQLLLAEGLAQLPKNINHLILIPDDILNYLPMDILIEELPKDANKDYSYKSIPYLFKKYGISYNYSASLFRVNLQKKGLKPYVGFAPAFNQKKIADSRTCFEDDLYGLYCNTKEVEDIQEILGGEIFTEENATVEKFESIVSEYQILHLATHACINEAEGALNKIFFSDEKSIFQKNLNNLELNNSLTVLSACNTGAGKLLEGEGVMSLARSFVMAGSESVLTSLWSIDDCATSEVMVNYFDQLNKGLSKDKAIGNAKLEYLKNADQSNAHPYYWAAFLQFGNTSPLIAPTSKVNNYLVIFSLIAGLLLFLFIKRKTKKSKNEIGNR